VGGPGAQRIAAAALVLAQRAAQSLAFKMRQNVLRLDDWMDESLSFAGGETGDTPSSSE
jgi:hypothetical protein